MKLINQLIQSIDSQLIMVLLCIWGVFPCKDYQYSLQSLFLLFQSSYNDSSFYNHFFSIQYKEGVSLTHYFLIMIILYLTDTRSLSLNQIEFPSSLFSTDQVCFLKAYCSLIEIRRDLILSEFVMTLLIDIKTSLH